MIPTLPPSTFEARAAGKRGAGARLALLTKLRAFFVGRDGVAAMEFAIIFPVLVTLYIGTVELTHAMTVLRKVNATAAAVADLVAQKDSVVGEVALIGEAAKIVMQPIPAEYPQFFWQVTQVRIDENGNPWLNWTRGTLWEYLGPEIAWSSISHETFGEIPSDLLVPNTFLIYGQARYDYTSLFNYYLPFMRMGGDYWTRPRMSACVKVDANCI